MTVQARNLTGGQPLRGVLWVLGLQCQFRVLPRVDRRDTLKPDAEAGKLRRHVGKPVG